MPTPFITTYKQKVKNASNGIFNPIKSVFLFSVITI
jgi:hypothetical protein